MKKSTSVRDRRIVLQKQFEQRFIVEANRSAIVASTDRMRDAISFVTIEKMNAARIANHVIATGSPFDEETSPRKN
jgi:hypothetical protein